MNIYISQIYADIITHPFPTPSVDIAHSAPKTEQIPLKHGLIEDCKMMTKSVVPIYIWDIEWFTLPILAH